MTHNYPDLGRASDWMKQISNQSEALRRSVAWCVFCALFSDVILWGNHQPHHERPFFMKGCFWAWTPTTFIETKGKQNQNNFLAVQCPPINCISTARMALTNKAVTLWTKHGLSITDVQSSINNLNPRVAKWPNHPQTYKADPKSETCKLLYLYNYFILYTRNYIFGLPRGRRLYGIPTPTNKFSVPFLLSHCDV